MQKDRFSYSDRSYALKTCDRLRKSRMSAGFTAAEVARHLNMPVELYLLYEETELVSHRFIAPLCEFLDVSPWFYLTGRPGGESPPFDRDS